MTGDDGSATTGTGMTCEGPWDLKGVLPAKERGNCMGSGLLAVQEDWNS